MIEQLGVLHEKILLSTSGMDHHTYYIPKYIKVNTPDHKANARIDRPSPVKPIHRAGVSLRANNFCRNGAMATPRIPTHYCSGHPEQGRNRCPSNIRNRFELDRE